MTNKEKIYEMFNEIDIDTKAYEYTEMTQNEKDEIFKHLKKQVQTKKEPTRSYRPIYLAVAAIFLLFIGSQTAIGQQVQATMSSFIEDIRYSLNQALGNEETDSSKGAIPFHQTARIEDAEIRLNEMVAFDHRIVFNVLIELNESIEEQDFAGFSNFSIEVNGEPLQTQGLVGRGEVYDEENNVHSIIYSTELTEDSFLEEDMIIDITFQDIHYYHPNELIEDATPVPPLEGEAHFTTETTMEELTEHTDVYEIDHFVRTGDYDYQIETLYVHPILNYIEVSSENWGDENFQLIEIRGIDDQERLVVFEQSSSMNAQEYKRNSFTLNESKSEVTTAELADVEYLELEFYSAGWPENGMAEYKAYGEPFVIEMEKNENVK